MPRPLRPQLDLLVCGRPRRFYDSVKSILIENISSLILQQGFMALAYRSFLQEMRRAASERGDLGPSPASGM